MASCEGPPAESALEPEEDPAPTKFRSEEFEDFPIIIDGVGLGDIDDDPAPYTFEIEPNVFIDLGDFADVVTRWTLFKPCEDGPESFSYDPYVKDFIAAAELRDLKLLWGLPYSGSIALPA
jgi:hypothetical protein